jgi:hypothetical protein
MTYDMLLSMNLDHVWRGRLCPHFERIKPAIYIDPVQLNTNKLLYGLCQTIDFFYRFIFATI